jgi:hypothetical protein
MDFQQERYAKGAKKDFFLVSPNLGAFASLRESSSFRFCSPKINRNFEYFSLV